MGSQPSRRATLGTASSRRPATRSPDPIGPAFACRDVKPNFELSCKLMFEREIVNRRHGIARHSNVHRALGDSWILTGSLTAPIRVFATRQWNWSSIMGQQIETLARFAAETQLEDIPVP